MSETIAMSAHSDTEACGYCRYPLAESAATIKPAGFCSVQCNDLAGQAEEMQGITSAAVRKIDTIDLVDALRDGRIDPDTPAGWLAECRLAEAQINPDDVAPAGDPNGCPF